MALSIDFECPLCKKKQLQDLLELTPGKKKICAECGVPTRLTDTSLRKLERSLQEYCLH